ncbi:MAG: flagellar motor protein MotB [Holophagaceae bacterium]
MADQQQPEIKIKFVKKKGGHAAAHGGAWKVAYADLVTAMMAFFLLMWLLNSADKNTKAGIAGMFQDANFFNTERGKEILANHGKGILAGGRGMAPGPDGDGGTDLAAESPGAAEEERKAMEATAESIEKAFQQDELLQAFQDQITMDFTDEGLRIQIQDKAAQVLFDSGSATLKSYTLSILKEIAKELGKLPNRVVIGGHTDSAQFSSNGRTNWELSSERANAARRVMESAAGGLRPGQVRRVTGYADTIPIEGKDPKDPQNRRISLIVVSAANEAVENKHHKAQPRETDRKAAASPKSEPAKH